MRSSVASSAEFTSSTSSTSNNAPMSRARSTAVLPIKKDRGSRTATATTSSRKATSCRHAAVRPRSDRRSAMKGRASSGLDLCRLSTSERHGEREQQFLLRGAAPGAARLEQLVAAVGAHLPGVAVVLQVGQQALADHAALERRVEHGEAQLDAAEEIAVHPVGAGEVHVLGAAVLEEEHARMLEEAPDDR